MTEEWRVLRNGPYEVSDLGRVRRGERLLRTRIAKVGYPVIGLRLRDGRSPPHYVHRLVAEAFLGPCPAGLEVNHKSGIKADSSLANLEYVTSGDNHRHGYRMGLIPVTRMTGEDHGMSKLTEDDVRAIREERRNGARTTTLGLKYGVGRSHISSICTRRTWMHVP